MSSQSEPKKPANNAEPPDDTQYDSAMKPLLWLLIPFALVLLYGMLT